MLLRTNCPLNRVWGAHVTTGDMTCSSIPLGGLREVFPPEQVFPFAVLKILFLAPALAALTAGIPAAHTQFMAQP